MRFSAFIAVLVATALCPAGRMVAGPITYNSALIATCIGSFGVIGAAPDPCVLQTNSLGPAITNSGTVNTSGETVSYSASSVSIPGSLGGSVTVSSNTFNSSGPGVMVDAL
jgi:hypothetical protein